METRKANGGRGNDLGKNGWRVDLLGNSRDRNDVLETHGGGCSFWESTADACWQPARRKEALPVMTGGERTSWEPTGSKHTFWEPTEREDIMGTREWLVRSAGTNGGDLTVWESGWGGSSDGGETLWGHSGSQYVGGGCAFCKTVVGEGVFSGPAEGTYFGNQDGVKTGNERVVGKHSGSHSSGAHSRN